MYAIIDIHSYACLDVKGSMILSLKKYHKKFLE